jgi:signal transduction histidine kinase
VVDNGVGIEPDQQSGLFQEFNQIDKNTLQKGGGSGMIMMVVIVVTMVMMV